MKPYITHTSLKPKLKHLKSLPFPSSYSTSTTSLADGNFLLRFLRMKKYRIREAQELLEKYLHMRTENTHWFHGLDIKDPMIEDLIDRGYFFALPERDDSGRRVFFSVAGKRPQWLEVFVICSVVVSL